MAIRYIFKLAIYSSLCVFATSCNTESDRSPLANNDLAKLKNELVLLEENLLSKMGKLGEKIQAVNMKVDEFEDDRFKDSLNKMSLSDFLEFERETKDGFMKLQEEIVSSKVVFNLKEQEGFSKINSGGLIFCVSIAEVQPYLEGFKVIFELGNPFSSSFVNPKITIKWGLGPLKYYQENKSEENSILDLLDSWEKSLYQKKTTILKELKPGIWNRFEVIVSPAKLHEIEYVEFSFDISTVSFQREANAP